MSKSQDQASICSPCATGRGCESLRDHDTPRPYRPAADAGASAGASLVLKVAHIPRYLQGADAAMKGAMEDTPYTNVSKCYEGLGRACLHKHSRQLWKCTW